MNRDRELLFAMLALKNDCLSGAELLSAVRTWTQNKSRSLVEVLQQLTTIDKNVCSLLHQMVEVLLEKHEGDVQKCLSSEIHLASIREDLLSLKDTDVEAMLSGKDVTSSDETFVPNSRYRSSQLSSPSGSSPTLQMYGESRFHVLRRHARGGLGEVFLARDEELNRDVALKEIQLKFSDDRDCRNRFVLEAEVTGGLEHPGIVPVYSLGQHDDGRPYYAMRFITGDSLKEAIDVFYNVRPSDPLQTPRSQMIKAESDRLLAFRKLLGRFVDVCQAVGYAHSRGVVHRDLKPANIMLGRYGETFVVDWGLAKILGKQESALSVDEQPLHPASGSGGTPTILGTAIGTPAFMSPEQAAGRVDGIGPRSDVYSLGATLYNLLTGVAPFSNADVRDLQRLLEKVRAGDFPRPRKVRSSVPLALEAICLKAMANHPEDRYPSPAALADDIDRWLADEPVKARKESTTERLSRLYRRQGLVFILGCVFIVGSFLVNVLMMAAAARIDAARYGSEEELDKVLRTLWASAWRNPLALSMPLLFFSNTLLIKLLTRWLYGTNISFQKAAATMLLVGMVSLPSPAIEVVLGWSGSASFVLSFVATFPVIVIIIRRVLSLSMLKVWGLLILLGLFNSLAMKPLINSNITKTYVAAGNAMAPTLCGSQHVGICPNCQGELVVPHRADWCDVCSTGKVESSPEKIEPNVEGICRNCLRISRTDDISTVVRPPDRMFVSLLRSPGRWDMISYRPPGNPPSMSVHRIVGLPGETITIVDGVMMANGRPVPLPDELQNLRYPIPLAARPSEVWGTMEHPAQLGENEFFVLGDYASVSNDSRMRNRAVHRNEIEGVIECRYWPLWRYQAFK